LVEFVVVVVVVEFVVIVFDGAIEFAGADTIVLLVSVVFVVVDEPPPPPQAVRPAAARMAIEARAKVRVMVGYLPVSYADKVRSDSEVQALPALHCPQP
jgi:hypothetical protein